MNLFVLGLRRSGTTILYDALGEDAELRRFYEPLREDAVTIGGGSGARDEDVFAETRAKREGFRLARFPELAPEMFNWGGPRAPGLEAETELPPHCEALLAELLREAESVAIKETRLHQKLPALARIDPGAAIVHLVRDPRAVCVSMLLGRRRRFDAYPDAAAFFGERTDRPLWSSRELSQALLERQPVSGLPAEIPDFLRPLIVWRAAFEAIETDGPRHFGDRYLLVRLEDLRRAPAEQLARIYAVLDRPLPPPVSRWAAANLRPEAPIHLGEDPRWSRAARLLGMEPALERAGYAEVLALEPAPGEPLDLSPPPRRGRLAGLIGRARRRAGTRAGGVIERLRGHRPSAR